MWGPRCPGWDISVRTAGKEMMLKAWGSEEEEEKEKEA